MSLINSNYAEEEAQLEERSMGPKKNKETKKKVVKSIAKVAVKETNGARIAREKREKRDRENQLYIACSNGQIDRVRELLDEGVDINAKDNLGNSPLICACANGHVDVATLLLDRDALIDEKSNDYNDTALHCAARNDEMLLISRGADPMAVNNFNNTALHFAACNDNMDICELLISIGADPMAVNRHNETPLDLIGFVRSRNPPDHPTLPPLTAPEKKERQDRLLEVFGEYLEWLRREDNWERRSPFMMFLRGCGFRPSLAEMSAMVAVQVPVDTSAPIPPVPRDWNYLTNQVFAHNPRVDDPQAQIAS